MTDSVDMYRFLLGQKPICTQTPIKSFLGRERHRELRAKYKDELSIDLLADRCDNTFNCKSLNEGCIGRPFPKDPEILKGLQSINVEITEGEHKGREVYLAKATVLCSECPFKDSCENSCATQDSYLKRSLKPDLSPKEHMCVSYDDYELGKFGPVGMDIIEETYVEPDYSWMEEELPLDCLSDQQRQIVELIVYKELDQSEASKYLKLDKGLVSRQYESALERLEEFGKVRKAIDKNTPQRVVEYYLNGKSHQEIADSEGIARTTVTMSINKWKAKYL